MIVAEKIDLLSVTEAARVVGATRGCIHYYRLAGRLPAISVEGRYLIPRESVEALQRERAAITAASKAPAH
jgi:excisionase family DNA binding protein